ncbi:MAG: ABC transporter permease [candidate division Zixibacteria bacterium]|nr:ABC transporter permease [candidate division Zixibacteria bacterium]
MIDFGYIKRLLCSMKYESFIARRYLKSGRFFISVSTWITILGVTLGVAVVCFVMSMHNGFESEIRTRLLGTTSHISIFPLRGGLINNYDEMVKNLESIDGVVAASPFIYYKAAISSSSAGDGIVIRGIDIEKERQASNIAGDIKLGKYSFEPQITEDDTIPGIILGKTLAQNLGIYIGERAVLYSLKGEDLHRKARPRVAKFYVSGIFETGMFEFDAQLAYISLESAQKLFRVGNSVTAVHLKLDNIYNAELMKPIIDSSLEYKYDVVPWYILHKNLFSWIAIEKKILFLGFILIVIVAAFSIISTLIMLTMEKREEIGILKTIGSTPASIRKIFVMKGMVIALAGVLSGWLIALLAAFIQNRYELISLPPDIYFITYLPIDVHLFDFLLAGIVTIIICYFAALYPASQAAKLHVVEVLRK